jgi:hypothetical protein
MHAHTRTRTDTEARTTPAARLPAGPSRTRAGANAHLLGRVRRRVRRRQPRGVLRRQRADEAARERKKQPSAASRAAETRRRRSGGGRPIALRGYARERSLRRKTRPESLVKTAARSSVRLRARAAPLALTASTRLGGAVPQRTVDPAPVRPANRRRARCGRGQGTHRVLTGYSGSAVPCGGAHLASAACRSALTPTCAARTCERRGMRAPPSQYSQYSQ